MFTSRTSVGVQERSASSSTVFVSEDTLCCCAWRRLDSSRDSICSWQARKQSCRRVEWKGRERERERPKSPLERSQAKTPFLDKAREMLPGYLGEQQAEKEGGKSRRSTRQWKDWMSKPIFLQTAPCAAASLPVFTLLYKCTDHNWDFYFCPRNPSAAGSASCDAH